MTRRDVEMLGARQGMQRAARIQALGSADRGGGGGSGGGGGGGRHDAAAPRPHSLAAAARGGAGAQVCPAGQRRRWPAC